MTDLMLRKGTGKMIYEKKLIEFLEKISEEYPYRIPGQPDTYSQYNEAWQDCIDRIESFVENQPKIGEWIPCSERLPEVGEKVIVSKDGKTLEEMFDFAFPEPYCDDDELIGFLEGDYSDSITITKDNKNIIAWQPLPESYHEP